MRKGEQAGKREMVNDVNGQIVRDCAEVRMRWESI